MDPPWRSRKLAARLGLTFPLLSDPGLKIIDAYGVQDPGNETAWPAVYVLAPSGRIVWRHLSETYKRRPPAATLDAALDATVRARP